MNLLLFIILLSPIIVFLIHALIIRFVKDERPQLTAIISALIGNIPILIICLTHISNNQIIAIEKITIVIYTLITYNSLAYVYFHVFNMSETARRVRILIELRKAGRIGRQDIFKQYSSDDIVDVRLDRLLSLKQLRVDGGIYRVDRRFLLFAAKAYSMWVSLLGGSS